MVWSSSLFPFLPLASLSSRQFLPICKLKTFDLESEISFFMGANVTKILEGKILYKVLFEQDLVISILLVYTPPPKLYANHGSLHQRRDTTVSYLRIFSHTGVAFHSPGVLSALGSPRAARIPQDYLPPAKEDDQLSCFTSTSITWQCIYLCPRPCHLQSAGACVQRTHLTFEWKQFSKVAFRECTNIWTLFNQYMAAVVMMVMKFLFLIFCNVHWNKWIIDKV